MKEGNIIEGSECEGLGSNPRWVADDLVILGGSRNSVLPWGIRWLDQISGT